MEDNLVKDNHIKEYQTRSYQDLSSEFQRLYPRVIQLIPIMYDRLTLIDNLSHKEAVAKIYNDHRHFSGFSIRNIRRNLPLDNASVPRRIRPSWPKNNITHTLEPSELSNTIQEQEQNAPISNDSEGTSKVEEKQQGQKIASQEGKSVVIDETSPDDKPVSHNESFATDDFLPSRRSYKQTIQECSSCLELQDKVVELSEALRGISIPTADQIPSSEFEFTISKEKYKMVMDAMDRSKSAIFVKYDGTKKFVRAVPDIDN